MNMHVRRKTYVCPCCGGSIGEAATLEQVRRFVTSEARLKIFDVLSSDPGAPIYRKAVSAAVYGVERSGNILSSQVSQLRREIEPYGWTITYSKGGRSDLAQWKLIPTGDAR